MGEHTSTDSLLPCVCLNSMPPNDHQASICTCSCRGAALHRQLMGLVPCGSQSLEVKKLKRFITGGFCYLPLSLKAALFALQRTRYCKTDGENQDHLLNPFWVGDSACKTLAEGFVAYVVLHLCMSMQFPM